MFRRLAKGVIPLLCLGGISGTLFADSHSVFPMRVEFGSWVFVGIEAEVAGSRNIESVLAYAKPGSADPNNLVAAWYVRDGANWIAKSWNTSNVLSVIEEIRSSRQISNDSDWSWGIGPVVHGLPGSGTPEPLITGLLESDPLAQLVAGTPDPLQVAQFLVANGYPAIVTPIDASACDPGIVLNDLSLAMEMCIYDATPDTAKLDAALNSTGFNLCIGGTTIAITDAPLGVPSPWSAPVCVRGEFANCMWKEVCTRTRTQQILRTRTRTCVSPAGVPVTCTQSTTMTCTENDVCEGPMVPGTTGMDGVCVAPAIFPPTPVGPCQTHSPSIPREGDGLWTPDIPWNCSSPGLWVPITCCP